MEKDRCDNEMEVFNAKAHKDEMIISIEEYKTMKEQIKYLKSKDEEQFKLRQRIRDENLELKSENIQLKTENQTLKKGIINFVRVLGG